MAKPADKWVKVVTPGGDTEEVREQDLSVATKPLEQGGRGYTLETPEQASLREYKKTKGDSFGEGAKAVVEHAGDALSFGLTTAALAQDPQYRENRKHRDQVRQTEGLAGTIIGSALPLGGGIGGALGKGIRTVSAPVNTVSRLSLQAGGAVERVLAGQAPGALRKLGSKVVGGGIAGGLEGAVIGAGGAVSEASLDNKDLTAELLLSRMGEGAAVGGVLGGGLGAVGEAFALGAKNGKSFLKHVPGVGEVTSARAESIANQKALTSLGFQKGTMRQLVKKYGEGAVDEIGADAVKILGLEGPGAYSRALKYDMGQGAELIAARKNELNESLTGIYRKLDETGGKVRVDEIVSRVEEQVLAPLQKSLSGSDDAVVREIRRELKPLYKALESAEQIKGAADAVPAMRQNLAEMGEAAAKREYETLRGMVDEFQANSKAVQAKYRELGLNEAANRVGGLNRELRRVARSNGQGINRLFDNVQTAFIRLDDEVAQQLARKGSPSVTFDQVHKLAQKQAERIKNFAVTQDPKQAAFRQYWGLLKDDLAAQAERAGVGPELKETNRKLRNIIALDTVAKESVAFGGNRSVSLSDTIIGGIGGGSGAVLGGGIGAALGAVGASTVNRFLRSAAADQVMAVGAGQFAAIRNAREVADKARRSLTSEVTRATGIPMRQRAVGLGTRLASEFDRQREQVVERQSEQARLLEQLQARTSEASAVAPELTASIVAAGGRGSAYLAASMPQAIELNDLHDRAGDPSIPESERAAWLRKLGVVKHPRSVVSNFKDGTLSSDEVETLKASYPALYEQIQSDALRAVSEGATQGRMPPYERRAQLSILTGVPLDASYRPDMIKAFQARYQKQATPAPAPVRRASASTGMAKRRASTLDREE